MHQPGVQSCVMSGHLVQEVNVVTAYCCFLFILYLSKIVLHSIKVHYSVLLFTKVLCVLLSTGHGKQQIKSKYTSFQVS